jgi:hypothetical protein
MSTVIMRSLILVALLTSAVGCTKPEPEVQQPPMAQGNQPGAPPAAAQGNQPGTTAPGADPNYTGPQPMPK